MPKEKGLAAMTEFQMTEFQSRLAGGLAKIEVNRVVMREELIVKHRKEREEFDVETRRQRTAKRKEIKEAAREAVEGNETE